jgi:sorbitol-specific phosphotransferase system component IIA
MSINKDKKPKLSERGQAKYFIDAAESTPADQVYREIAKNSLEACAKMKKINFNFEGEIKVGEDPTFPNKLTIVDNGIGMSKDKISDLIINLSETEEESEHGNKGVGTKISGFANNKDGMIYSSKRYGEEEGSRCRVYFNDNDLFAVEHSDEYNSCTIPLDKDELPELIQKYKSGTSLSLCGNSPDENTLMPPENYEEGSLLRKSRMGIHWLKAYYNTKFFRIPDYIKFMVEIKRESRSNYERVYGHEHWLNHFADKSGILYHDSADIHWWILSDTKGKRNSAIDCVMNGQLGFINNDEMIELDFDTTGAKNPLRNWGLPFSCGDVAIIIEPKGFQQDQYRTGLRKKRAPLKNFKSIWKDFFIDNMPHEIKEYEASLAKKFSEKMADDGIFQKEINKWLKDMNFIQAMGDITSQKLPLMGHITTTKGNYEGDFNGGSESVDPGKKPKSNFGKNLLYAGMKDKKSKHKAMSGKINAMPEVILDYSKNNDDLWVWYDYDHNKAYLNGKCRMINYYAKEAFQQNKSLTFTTHKENTLIVLRKILSTHIALTRFGSNNLSEEEKKEILTNDKCLSMVILNPYLIPKEILSMSKHLKQQLAEVNKSKSLEKLQ